MRTSTADDVARQAVGGDFEEMGQLQYAVLRKIGLRDDDYVIDVGCGSGRTACALRDIGTLRYLGIDVVPELIAYARQTIARPDWTFAVVEGLTIPERDAQADLVVMFSVLTHLTRREGWKYLSDAVRVLKPGGRIIASFLDTELQHHKGAAGHWFTQMRERLLGRSVRNQLLRKDDMRSWANKLNVRIELSGPEGIGQSYAVITK